MEARQRDGVRALRIGLVVVVPEVDQEAAKDVKSQIVCDKNLLSAKTFGTLVPARKDLDLLNLSKIVGEAPILVLEMIELEDQNPLQTGMEVPDPLITEKQRTTLSSNLPVQIRLVAPIRRKVSNDSIPNQNLPPQSEKDTLHNSLNVVI